MLETYCTKSKEKSGGGVADRDAMRLMPGDVGLRGDRATFSLCRDDGLTHHPDTTGNGAVFYNMRPSGFQPEQDDELDGDSHTMQQMSDQEQEVEYDHQEQDWDCDTQDRNPDQDQDNIDPDQENDQDHDQQPVDESGDQPWMKDRKHVMEMLPASVKPKFGPVTGLPVSDDEHVFVLWLGKRPGEPDEKARLQIEVRVPKWVPEPEPVPETAPTEAKTVEVLPEVTVNPKVGKKKKRNTSKKSNGSKKSGSSKKR